MAEMPELVGALGVGDNKQCRFRTDAALVDDDGSAGRYASAQLSSENTPSESRQRVVRCSVSMHPSLHALGPHGSNGGVEMCRDSEFDDQTPSPLARHGAAHPGLRLHSGDTIVRTEDSCHLDPHVRDVFCHQCRLVERGLMDIAFRGDASAVAGRVRRVSMTYSHHVLCYIQGLELCICKLKPITRLPC